MCVLLIDEGKHNHKILSFYDSNQDSTLFYKNRIICVLLIVDGKHSCKIARFYNSNRDCNFHG